MTCTQDTSRGRRWAFTSGMKQACLPVKIGHALLLPAFTAIPHSNGTGDWEMTMITRAF